MRAFLRVALVAAAVWAVGTFLPKTAQACGGFFCNSAQPVNQAAEGIIFADNGDGTTTAVIQIQYQGPSQNFSWLLPISSVPKSDEIAIASNVAFQRLQSATNPSYNLTTRIEGTCRDSGGDESGCGSSNDNGRSFASGPGGAQADPSVPEVVVEAAGVVGA